MTESAAGLEVCAARQNRMLRYGPGGGVGFTAYVPEAETHIILTIELAATIPNRCRAEEGN